MNTLITRLSVKPFVMSSLLLCFNFRPFVPKVWTKQTVGNLEPEISRDPFTFVVGSSHMGAKT